MSSITQLIWSFLIVTDRNPLGGTPEETVHLNGLDLLEHLFKRSSSSQGLTSRVTIDLAAALGLPAFLLLYSAARSALILSASSSSSSSEPKRSTSSSSSSAAAAAAEPPTVLAVANFVTGKVENSGTAKQSCLNQQRATLGYFSTALGARPLKTATSAWEAEEPSTKDFSARLSRDWRPISYHVRFSWIND